MHQQSALVPALMMDRVQGMRQHGGHPWVTGCRRLVLVGDQLGLHCHTDEFIDRLHDILDRGDAAVGERNQSGRYDAHLLAGG